MNKADVRLEDGYYTTAEARSHTFHSDLPEDGDDLAPTPEELLMGALGSCMSQTAKLYAARKGWPLEGVKVSLDFERFRGSDYEGYDGEAAFVHEIREHVILEGPLDEKQKARIREIMGKCPVRRVLSFPVIFVESETVTEEQLPIE